MKIIFILLSVINLIGGQIYHVVPLKEARHLQALQQPHLPKDSNVVSATRQFLNRFAELKALADAAPDPLPQGKRKAASQQSNHLIFNHHGLVGNQQQIPVYVPQHQQQQQQLVFHHQPLTHHQQQQNNQHHHQQQPNNHHHHRQQPNHHQQQQQHHHQQQPTHHHQNRHHGMVPVVNAQGIVVNPNRYPGPLAHHMPANVG